MRLCAPVNMFLFYRNQNWNHLFLKFGLTSLDLNSFIADVSIKINFLYLLFESLFIFNRFYINNRSDSPHSTRSVPWCVWSTSGPPRNPHSSHSPRSVRSAGPQLRLTHARRSSSVESQSSTDSRPCRKLVVSSCNISLIFLKIFTFSQV